MLIVAYRYDDDRLFARAVTAVRGGDSGHCEIAVRSVLGYFCISSSAMDGGVRGKHMELPPEKWRLYQTDIPDAAAFDYLVKNVGRPYGWLGLVRFVFPFIRPSSRGPICTEVCAQILGMPDTDSWDVRAHEAAVAWRYPRIQ